ncbi:MAG: lysine 2,3-aminomutase [Spirochaetia bacterium]|jgi:lysine 2,3-aminomutase|nr:lysine 2,3-aminomutase [Spirochaetia bacterium]
MVKTKKNRIKEYFYQNIEKSKWKEWAWQLRHTIRTLERFEELTGIAFSEKERESLEETIERFPVSITPYYLSLIDIDNYKNDPVFKQSFPDKRELEILKNDMSDPLSEEADSPVEGITHRYPDRVLFHISNICSMYCRHCTRKRKVGDIDSIPDKEAISKGIEYIRNNKQIRDVLLSGGDPFMLSDNYLDWILSELSSIEHVEVLRIGTRMPVVLPYRITDSLVEVLKKYKNLWINTHFNHPKEITEASEAALAKLAEAGIPLGNQSVLLRDVNDCPRLIKKLCQMLVKNRVRPYYLYQCDLSEGLNHFRTSVGKGVEILENMIGHTSGFCVPTYVVDAPGGGGKIPVLPNYLISWSSNKIILRNYEGVITTYTEPQSYHTSYCDNNCRDCRIDFSDSWKKNMDSVGIEKLLCEYDKANTLIPGNNPRLMRREENVG